MLLYSARKTRTWADSLNMIRTLSDAPQGFIQLLNSPAAVAAAGSEAAATAAASRVPLLVRRTPPTAALSAAAAQQQPLQQQLRGLASLLPSAAAAASPCWRAPAAAATAVLGRRGYAQLGTRAPKSSYSPPPEMQRAMQMRLSMVSANLLAEPYRGVPPRLPLTAYFTLAGWKEVGRRFLGQCKSLYTIGKCK